jgi:RNA-binding protein YlmH
MSDRTDSFDAFDGETLDLVLPSTLDAIRVDRVISMLTGLSRSEANTMVSEGSVRVNGRVVLKSSQVLEEGQHLVAV